MTYEFAYELFAGLGASWRTVLWFEILCKAAWLVLLGPMVAGLLHALIVLGGNDFVGNERLAKFVLSPLGIVSIVVTATLGLALVLAELAGLVVIANAGLHQERIQLLTVLDVLLVRAVALLRVSGAIVGLLLLVLLPFAAAGGLVYRLLLSKGDINFYVSTKPPAFRAAVVIGGVLTAGLVAVATYVSVRWLFAVPMVLFKDAYGLRALGDSAALIRGHSWVALGWIVGWQAASVTIAGGVMWLLRQLNDRVLRAAEARFGAAVSAFVGLLAFDWLVLSAISMINLVGFGFILAGLFERAGRSIGIDWLLDKRVSAGSGSRAGAVILLAGLVVAAFVHARILVRRFSERKAAGVTAHRAGARRAPENSLSALRGAIEDRADMAEIDVQETSDGVVVVIHDSDLRRLCKVDRNVWETGYDELRAMDAGSSFGTKFAGERIPTLDEFVATAKGKIGLNVELKYDGHDQKLAERVVEILRRHDFAKGVVVTSLELRGLQEMRKLDPSIKLGYILAAGAGDMGRLDVDVLSVSTRLATPKIIRQAGKRGLGVHVWTVNEREEMVRMLTLGVDNLITDDAALGRQVISWFGGLGDAELMLMRLRQWLKR